VILTNPVSSPVGCQSMNPCRVCVRVDASGSRPDLLSQGLDAPCIRAKVAQADLGGRPHMHQAVVRDIQQLDIVPEFQQRCCHNRLHEVVVIDGDCPVFLLCDPHLLNCTEK
jgi:hypothetical protein